MPSKTHHPQIVDIIYRYFYRIQKSIYINFLKLYWFGYRPRLPVLLFEGSEKTSGERLITLIVGKSGDASYWSQLIYSGVPAVTPHGKCIASSALSITESLPITPDLIIVDLGKINSTNFDRHGYATVPKWIPFALDMSNYGMDIDKLITSGGNAKSVKKVLRKKFTYVVSHSKDDLRLFYYEMYVPYAQRRFGDSAQIYSYKFIRSMFYRCRLLFVEADSKQVAGVLLIDTDNELMIHSLGVSSGNVEYVKQGVLFAAYYYAFKWASENEYTRINFGYCRPFLSDGVLAHKKRWGAEVYREYGLVNLGSYAIKACTRSRGVRGFLSNNPVMVVDGGELKGLVYSEASVPLSAEDVLTSIKTNYVAGLDRLIVVSPSGFSSAAKEAAMARYGESVTLNEMGKGLYFESVLN